MTEAEFLRYMSSQQQQAMEEQLRRAAAHQQKHDAFRYQQAQDSVKREYQQEEEARAPLMAAYKKHGIEKFINTFEYPWYRTDKPMPSWKKPGFKDCKRNVFGVWG